MEEDLFLLYVGTTMLYLTTEEARSVFGRIWQQRTYLTALREIALTNEAWTREPFPEHSVDHRLAEVLKIFGHDRFSKFGFDPDLFRAFWFEFKLFFLIDGYGPEVYSVLSVPYLNQLSSDSWKRRLWELLETIKGDWNFALWSHFADDGGADFK